MKPQRAHYNAAEYATELRALRDALAILARHPEDSRVANLRAHTRAEIAAREAEALAKGWKL